MKNNIGPSPWDLHYFQEIAQTQSLSRAAERLGIGQPALSVALKRLEESLGKQLFERRNRGMTLTQAGKLLSREIDQLSNHWQKIVSEVKRSDQEVSGRFTLGCHASVAVYSLQEIVEKIYRKYPEIELRLVHGLSRVICENIVSGQADFGLVVNPKAHPDLVIKRLATDEVTFWKSAQSLSDVLIYHPELVQSQNLLKRLGSRVKFRRTIESGSLEVVATLTASGAGIGILPSRVAALYAPKFRRLTDWPTYKDEIALVYRSDFPGSAGFKALLSEFRGLKI